MDGHTVPFLPTGHCRSGPRPVSFLRLLGGWKDRKRREGFGIVNKADTRCMTLPIMQLPQQHRSWVCGLLAVDNVRKSFLASLDEALYDGTETTLKLL
jgi:hypothetical protein